MRHQRLRRDVESNDMRKNKQTPFSSSYRLCQMWCEHTWKCTVQSVRSATKGSVRATRSVCTVSASLAVTYRSQVTPPVTLFLLRPSESPFAFLSSSPVLFLTFHRLARRHRRHLRRTFVEKSLVVSEEVRYPSFASGEKPATLLTCMDEDDQQQHRRVWSLRLSSMCVVVFRRGCFCPSRNLSTLIQSSFAGRVHLPVVLNNRRQCLQLDKIQLLVRPFVKRRV